MKPLLRGEEADSEISKRQRFADRRSLEKIFGGIAEDRHIRNERIHEAVMEHGYTLTALQKYLGLHPSTLSRITKRIGTEVMQETRPLSSRWVSSHAECLVDY